MQAGAGRSMCTPAIFFHKASPTKVANDTFQVHSKVATAPGRPIFEVCIPLHGPIMTYIYYMYIYIYYMYIFYLVLFTYAATPKQIEELKTWKSELIYAILRHPGNTVLYIIMSNIFQAYYTWTGEIGT
jgi:hypothetical protein